MAGFDAFSLATWQINDAKSPRARIAAVAPQSALARMRAMGEHNSIVSRSLEAALGPHTREVAGQTSRAYA